MIDQNWTATMTNPENIQVQNTLQRAFHIEESYILCRSSILEANLMWEYWISIQSRNYVKVNRLPEEATTLSSRDLQCNCCIISSSQR